jgi:hypothetical protein
MKHGLLIQIGGGAKPKPKRPVKPGFEKEAEEEEQEPESKQTKRDIGFMSDSQYCGNCKNNSDGTCKLIDEEVGDSDSCLFGWEAEDDEMCDDEEEEEEEDDD